MMFSLLPLMECPLFMYSSIKIMNFFISSSERSGVHKE
nr:MAG TPA: hypothetical protein [Caudoviricetes sp.]